MKLKPWILCSCFLLSAAASLPLAAQTNTFPSSGNVGIGTTSPGVKLDVIGGAIRADGGIVSHLSSAGGLFVGYGSGLDGSSTQLFAIYADTTNGLYFDAPKDSSGNKLDIQFNWRGGGTPGVIVKGASGNVGVGTSSPQSLLHVYRASSVGLVADGIQVDRPGSPGCYAFLSYGGGANGEAGDTAYFGSVYAGGTKESLCLRVSDGTANIDARLVNRFGNVGIGTTNPTQKLSVNGTIRAKEMIVDTGWSDYVFSSNYRLAPLSEVEGAIQKDGHLPGIPSAAEVADHGISVGEMQAKLLAKIEELTLHQIAQEKRISRQQEEILTLRSQINRPPPKN